MLPPPPSPRWHLGRAAPMLPRVLGLWAGGAPRRGSLARLRAAARSGRDLLTGNASPAWLLRCFTRSASRASLACRCVRVRPSARGLCQLRRKSFVADLCACVTRFELPRIAHSCPPGGSGAARLRGCLGRISTLVREKAGCPADADAEGARRCALFILGETHVARRCRLSRGRAPMLAPSSGLRLSLGPCVCRGSYA